MAKIFISYKRVNKDRVFKLKKQIDNALHLDCWIDTEGIESDAQFINVIISAINKADILLFMYSHAHTLITDYSKDWTIRELNFAQIKNKRIIFLNIDKTPLTDWFLMMFGTKQQIDATSDAEVQKLIRNLATWLGKETAPTLDIDDIHGKSDTTTLSNVEGFDVGYDMARFAIYKLRGQTTSKQESEMKQKMTALGLDTKLLLDNMSAENIIQRLNDCAYNLGVLFGKNIESSVCLGALFVLSVIAKRSRISEEFGHYYDKAIIMACRQLNIDTSLVNRLINSNDDEMEDMLEEIKNRLYML